ncbi:MAG: hypothetical protein IK127_08855 [Clostridia bacterium]|nr:hypothetical protein [Clostridia bacterium]
MQDDPKSTAPQGETSDAVNLSKQPTGPMQPVKPAYQQPAPQAYQQTGPQQTAQAYQQPAPQAYQGYQQPAQQAYRNYQQPTQQAQPAYQQPQRQAQPAYQQQPPRQAQPAYQQPPQQTYRQPAPNYAQPGSGSTDFESVVQHLRNRKLRRLGMILIFTWLALIIGLLTLFIGSLATGTSSSFTLTSPSSYSYSSYSSYTVKSSSVDFWTVLMGILLILFSPIVLLLFEYGGFSHSYEGRRFPSSLFSGTRVFVIIVIPVIALIASKADLSGLSFNGANASGVMAIIGTIMFAVGFLANTILFYIYSFTSAEYNGKGFMVTGLIFAIMQILGILLFIVAMLIEGILRLPWWGYIGFGFTLIGLFMQFISYVVGYAPAQSGSSRFGGGPAGGYRSY